MSTLKVNKIRDTAGSADSITLDPNGGAVIAGVTTVSTIKVGSGVTISSDGDVFHTGVCTATSFVGDAASLTQIPAANIVGVCTAGFSRTGGFGGLLQLVSTTKTDHFSTTSSSLTEVTGLNVTITPSATSSKVYLNIDVSVGGETSYIGFNIKRDSTLIAVTAGVDGNDNRHQGTFATTVSGNSTLRTIGFSFLDTPNTTSAVTYKIFTISTYSSNPVSINRTHATGDASYNQGGTSTITAIEIAG